jgi:Ca2+-binding RTX toxin-like protein
MKRRTFIGIGIGLAALAVTLALATSSALATTYVRSDPPIPSFQNGGLYLTASKFDDQVTVGFDAAANQFVITDPAGVSVGIGPAVSCTAESPTVARCPQTAPFVGAFIAAGNDQFVGETSLSGFQVAVYGASGDDTITTSGLALLHGGRGDDTLTGGLSGDRIRGEEGRDRLIGRRGRDNIGGGPGRDRFDGGRGDDLLRAEDGERDLSLRCGAGVGDTALFDVGLDPAPIRCRHLNDPDAWP